MKKKTIKSILKKNKINRRRIFAEVNFADGRILRIPVYADDQDAIENLKQQFRDKNGTFSDTQNNIFDLKKLVSYRFVD